MATVKNYTELNCWKESRLLVQLVYSYSNRLAEFKQFNLINQFERAAVSVMNNIAEGFDRLSLKEKIRFLNISVSSANEVDSMTYILQDLQLLSESEVMTIREQVRITKARTLAFIVYLRSKLNTR
ncbi:MAG: four helix bundle protein [Flavobacteriia bacterium]|nr:four helix bundle protein [Flavobacteriia bacterium]